MMNEKRQIWQFRPTRYIVDEKRYVLIADVTDAMRENTIPYGIHPAPLIVEIAGINYELLKWRGDKPKELWSEYPVMGNTEMSDYISTHATLSPLPKPE